MNLRDKLKCDESLRDFITRFSNETLQVKDFDHTVTIAAFTNGLKDKDFTKSLTKKPSKVFTDLLVRMENVSMSNKRWKRSINTKTKQSQQERMRNHSQKEDVHPKITSKKEPELLNLPPVCTIKEIKGQKSLREETNIIKAITKGIQTTSKN